MKMTIPEHADASGETAWTQRPLIHVALLLLVLSAFGMLQESIHTSDHVARVREQGFRRLVLGGFDSVKSQALVQQLQQEPAVELVRDRF